MFRYSSYITIISIFFLLGSSIKPARTLFLNLLTLYWSIRIACSPLVSRCPMVYIISYVSSLILLYLFLSSVCSIMYSILFLYYSPAYYLYSGCSLIEYWTVLQYSYYLISRRILTYLIPRRAFLPERFSFFYLLRGSNR
jgi:hypothetical protein